MGRCIEPVISSLDSFERAGVFKTADEGEEGNDCNTCSDEEEAFCEEERVDRPEEEPVRAEDDT